MSAGKQGSRLGLGLLAAVVVVAVALGLWRARRHNVQRVALPKLNGILQVAGLDAPVEILRDPQGIPHVLAGSERDAWLGLGFAHAQDRLAQMLWLVRLARGRTAELLGPRGLEADRLARVLDLGGVADREWAKASPESRAWLEAYARGVNARIERVQAGQVGVPVPAIQAGLPMEPWSPADSLAVLKLHAWSLGGSLEASLVLHDLLGHLGGVDARPFFPGPGDAGMPGGDRLPLTAQWLDPLRRATGLAGASAGSSAWVLGGAHTLGGKPLLAADLHVAPSVPALFHLAHLRGGALDVAGVMIPGVPIVWTGRSPRVVWASTHARASVTDLYVEMVEEQARYHDGRRWRPLEERVETIPVAGAADETLVVASTVHGPLLEPVLGEGREPLALAWVGLRGAGVETLEAWRGVALATDAAGLRSALSGVGEPVVAVVYADADGEAGLQVAGWIPRRPLETGLVPVPGRARWYDWNGRVPFDRLPRRTLKDGRGWLVVADNVLPHPGVERPEWLWREGARARRIEARLRELQVEEPIGLGPLTEIQNDLVDARGAALVRAALALIEDELALDSHTAEVASLLEEWDGVASADSAGAAAYHAFATALTRALLEPALGEDLLRRYLAVSQADPAAVVSRMVRLAAMGGEPETWTDPARVTPAVRESLRDAWFQLSSRLGASRRKWSWGRLHSLRFAPLLPTGAAQPPELGPLPIGGSSNTIATAEYAPEDPFAVRLAAVVRFAADAGDPSGFRAALAPGQSEHPRSPHHTDGVEPWRAGRLERGTLAEDQLREGAATRLVLEPSS